MSVKSGRGLAASRPDLGTLVEEDVDDLPNRHTIEAEIEPEPCASSSSSPLAGRQRSFRHAQSEEGRTSYETVGSRFSMENVDKITHRIRASSPSSQNLSTSSRTRSPTRKHRKSASVSIETTTPELRIPNFDYIMAQASAKADITSTTGQRRFSIMNLLNNVTAPMRRTKTATEPNKRKEKKSKVKVQKERSSKRSQAPSVSDQLQISGSAATSSAEPSTQPPSVPCSSFDVCQVTDNLSDVYRPANSTLSNDKTLYYSSLDDTLMSAGGDAERMECQVCFVQQSAQNFPVLSNCDHRPCHGCLIKYLQIEIMESRISLACPECVIELHPNDIQTVLKNDAQLLSRYERFMIRKVLITEGDVRWCPAPDCDYAVIASGCAACPQLECQRPGCGTLFCYHCKGEWHANQTCDEARGQSVERIFNAATAANTSAAGDTTGEFFKPGDLKACPRCGTLIVKMNDGSCNHMVCPMCQADFCWLCLKEISDLHYLSPTGCTFWGKKPWTRKKKLLWQIGTLIGAPVGIALIAGLAVPGIICGVPVFVGRKAYQRFKLKSKGKRRLVTAASVAGSLIVSPVLAVMAVGVGVPIMLAYVYGVVPLSLCRNGGCASVQTSDDDDKSPRLLELAEDAELGRNFLTSLRANSNNEKSRLIGKKSRDDKIDATSVVTINSGFSSIVGSYGPYGPFLAQQNPSTPHPTKYGATSLPTDSMSQQSASLSAGPSLAVNEQRKRKVSVESCVNSMGEKCNFECASTKAHAGSHYHFDNKSVNTVCSGAGPEVQSYNEESASVLAMSGSIGGLEESGSIKNRQKLQTKLEHDLSTSDAV
ncbi:unnamed protein product [Bursaphelenchus okinawaensis]|uniref:RBR-type E3 ubiquitin transferase n=1 Tax=Bursaphelenchus okinawaensis TaxID=465554 RepID=A0A811LUI6_9BILA|nr:unnamed protein product [Bursaphelenchus okinawaensis]CAG9127889.1 unnamed protein product [Bursaphelenchus okinawaensis]